MSNETTKIKKISSVKKNISIFKKDKIIKIKCTPIPQKKSMDDAIKANEVLLWGLNRIDSILLGPYEKNYTKDKTKQNNLTDSDKLEVQSTNIEIQIDNASNNNKTTDTEYIPEHKYNLADLDWLNNEYDRIEKRISQMTELTDEYDNLLELQDNLTDLINELEYELKSNMQNYNITEPDEKEVLMEIEIKSTKPINPTNPTNPIKQTKAKKTTKTKNPKPYFWIGEIPDGYREATEEEAIINKKVSLFGKKRVQRELYSLFEITGTIYLNLEDPVKLNQQIIGLKGKLKFYKRELEFNNTSLDLDTISPENENRIKNKIIEINDHYKKTLDVLNLYIIQYNKIK